MGERENFWRRTLCCCRRIPEKFSGIFSISGREFLWLAGTFVFLLAVNYLLIALHGFSLSYAKSMPDISVLGKVFFWQIFLWSGHFILQRSRWYLWSVVTIHFLVLFVLLGIYLTTGTFFCESVLVLVYDTTASEAAGFFSAYVDIMDVLILLAVLAGYFLMMHFAMKLCCRRKKYCRGDGYALLVSALILLFPAVEAGCQAYSEGGETAVKNIFAAHPFYGIYHHIRLFNDHAGQFTVEMRRRKPPENVSLHPSLQKNPPVGVLVIGESAIRSHHGIYGYSRNTTPFLAAEQDNMVLFTDTITVLPMTVTALKYWLTDMTLEDRHLKWTLFDALKKGGYRIDVITNQNKSGWADSPLQMIFSSADTVTYMHEENYSDLKEDADARIYDGLMLPEVKKRFSGIVNAGEKVPRLVVIHLFGSHEPYSSRYPADFATEFLKDKNFPALVNEYDTSILYTDMVLGMVLEELKKVEAPGYMIYFADHGSVCEEKNLRTPGSVNNSAYEIPFLVWSNEEFRKNLPETWQRMKKNHNVPLQSDRAHFGLLEIMGLDFPEKMSGENFLSEGFIRKPRTVMEGAMPYEKEDK